MKTVYTITEYRYGLDLDEIKVGDTYIFVSLENLITGAIIYRLVPDDGGIPGNSDPSVRRYHGWRGTTSNVAVYAEGLRRVERVDAVKVESCCDRTVKVKLSADLAPDRA